VSAPMTLSDLEGRDMRVKFFRRISLITVVPFDYRTINFSRITQVGRGLFLGVSDAPTAKGRGPSDSRFWGFPSIYAYTL